MIELKTQYPYIDEMDVTHENLIRHFAEDEDGNKYYIQQIETGNEYAEAVDMYPCKYTYVATDKKIVEVEDDRQASTN